MASKFTDLNVAGWLTVGGIAGVLIKLATMSGGTEVLTIDRVIYSSGGTLPIYGSLSLSETNGVSSGTLAIQNPYGKTLLCGAPVLDVTTAASPVTVCDMATATGAIASTVATSNTLFNDVNLGTTGVKTSSGTLVSTSDGPKMFKLDPAGGTTDYVNMVCSTGSGYGLAGKYYIPCFAQD